MFKKRKLNKTENTYQLFLKFSHYVKYYRSCERLPDDLCRVAEFLQQLGVQSAKKLVLISIRGLFKDPPRTARTSPFKKGTQLGPNSSILRRGSNLSDG